MYKIFLAFVYFLCYSFGVKVLLCPALCSFYVLLLKVGYIKKFALPLSAAAFHNKKTN